MPTIRPPAAATRADVDATVVLGVEPGGLTRFKF
jgi:hypothetical protein